MVKPIATMAKKHTKRTCISCYHNLSKLKKLCKVKGLQMSFNKKYNMCQKHSDRVTIIYNIFKEEKLAGLIEKSVKNTISNTIKDLQKKKYTRKCNKVLTDWTVEETCTSDQIPPVLQKGDTIESSKEATEEYSNNTNVEQNESLEESVSQVIPITMKCTGKPNNNKCNVLPAGDLVSENKKFIPNELDSLGMFTCSQENEEVPTENKVTAWKQFGTPYVHELPQSQYDIPTSNDEMIKKQLGWISPALSPIFHEY